MKLGRPRTHIGRSRRYNMELLGDQEVDLFEEAERMADKAGIAIKYIMLDGLYEYIHGRLSVSTSPFLKELIKIKKEEITIKKAKVEEKELKAANKAWLAEKLLEGK